MIQKLKIIALAICFYILFFQKPEKEKYEKNYNLNIKNMNEIKIEDNLLTKEGKLKKNGFAKKYLINLNKESIQSFFTNDFIKYFNLQRFDHVAFFFDNKIIHMAVSNLNYGGNFFISYFDYKENKMYSRNEKMVVGIDTLPELEFSPHDCKSNYTFKKGDINYSLLKIKEGNICVTKINLEIQKENINANFEYKRNMDGEDIYDINPITEDGLYWFYGNKSLNNKCSLKFKIKTKNLNKNLEKNKKKSIEENLRGSENNCIALSDYGRAIFKKNTHWRWATGATKLKSGKIFSFNFADGIIHNSTKAEGDYFKLGDKLYNLNPIVISYDPQNLLLPIYFKTHPNFDEFDYNKTEISFKPQYKHLFYENLFIVKADFKYIYGVFKGWVTDDKGEKVFFDRMEGIVEYIKMKVL